MLLDVLRPYLAWLITAAVIALAAGSGFVGLRAHYIHLGEARAIERIAAQDQEAIDAADEARKRVRACVDAGGLWDAASGVCRRR